jgi:hypothetical protein
LRSWARGTISNAQRRTSNVQRRTPNVELRKLSPATAERAEENKVFLSPNLQSSFLSEP